MMLELDEANCSGGTRVTCMDCEAPRNLLGFEKRLLTRTLGTLVGSMLASGLPAPD